MDQNTDTSTTSTSEADLPTAGAGDAGAAADGGAGGTQAGADGADAFAAERERFESTVRQLQSERDRATARAARIEAALAEGEGEGQGGSASDQNDPLLERIAGLESMLRRQQVSPVAAELRSADEFTIVAELRPDLFDPDQYADADALRAAVQAEAQRLNPIASAMEERIRAEVLAEVSEKYGLRLAPKAPEGEEKHGDPDVATLAGMSVHDLDPEQVLRVLRSTT